MKTLIAALIITVTLQAQYDNAQPSNNDLTRMSDNYMIKYLERQELAKKISDIRKAEADIAISKMNKILKQMREENENGSHP